MSEPLKIELEQEAKSKNWDIIGLSGIRRTEPKYTKLERGSILYYLHNIRNKNTNITEVGTNEW